MFRYEDIGHYIYRSRREKRPKLDSFWTPIFFGEKDPKFRTQCDNHDNALKTDYRYVRRPQQFTYLLQNVAVLVAIFVDNDNKLVCRGCKRSGIMI